MEKFNGTFKQISCTDNFGAFMKEIGVGMATRTIGTKIKGTYIITQSGNHFKFESKSTFKNHTVEFDLDKEFETDTVDGRRTKTIFRWQDGKLVQEETPLNNKDAKPATYIRELDATGDIITVTCKSGDITCIRKYERSAE